MTNNLKRQVEVQGTKKLDRVKGVQNLKPDELKELEGGSIIVVAAVSLAAGFVIGYYVGSK